MTLNALYSPIPTAYTPTDLGRLRSLSATMIAPQASRMRFPIIAVTGVLSDSVRSLYIVSPPVRAV